MSSEDHAHQVYRDYLERRQLIAQKTAERLEASPSPMPSFEIIQSIPLDEREAIEDAFYKEQGKFRYTSSDGRTLFLTPEEIAERQRSKKRKVLRTQTLPPLPGRRNKRSRMHSSEDEERKRRYTLWAFNVGVVVLALALVQALLR